MRLKVGANSLKLMKFRGTSMMFGINSIYHVSYLSFSTYFVLM